MHALCPCARAHRGRRVASRERPTIMSETRSRDTTGRKIRGAPRLCMYAGMLSSVCVHVQGLEHGRRAASASLDPPAMPPASGGAPKSSSGGARGPGRLQGHVLATRTGAPGRIILAPGQQRSPVRRFSPRSTDSEQQRSVAGGTEHGGVPIRQTCMNVHRSGATWRLPSATRGSRHTQLHNWPRICRRAVSRTS